jgi:hypothetical protein
LDDERVEAFVDEDKCSFDDDADDEREDDDKSKFFTFGSFALMNAPVVLFGQLLAMGRT